MQRTLEHSNGMMVPAMPFKMHWNANSSKQHRSNSRCGGEYVIEWNTRKFCNSNCIRSMLLFFFSLSFTMNNKWDGVGTVTTIWLAFCWNARCWCDNINKSPYSRPSIQIENVIIVWWNTFDWTNTRLFSGW